MYYPNPDGLFSFVVHNVPKHDPFRCRTYVGVDFVPDLQRNQKGIPGVTAWLHSFLQRSIGYKRLNFGYLCSDSGDPTNQTWSACACSFAFTKNNHQIPNQPVDHSPITVDNLQADQCPSFPHQLIARQSIATAAARHRRQLARRLRVCRFFCLRQKQPSTIPTDRSFTSTVDNLQLIYRSLSWLPSPINR